MASVFTKVEIYISGRKPWTIVRCLDQISFHAHISSLEGGAELKLGPKCSSWNALSDVIFFFAEVKISISAIVRAF